jgi:hypothetical protein
MPHYLCPPTDFGSILPIGNQVANIIDATAVGPWFPEGCVRETCEAEASFEIGKSRIGNPELERLGCHDQMILLIASYRDPFLKTVLRNRAAFSQCDEPY